MIIQIKVDIKLKCAIIKLFKSYTAVIIFVIRKEEKKKGFGLLYHFPTPIVFDYVTRVSDRSICACAK